MAMHNIIFEYEDARIMLAVLDDEQLGKTFRAIIEHAVSDNLDKIPETGNRAIDAFVTKACNKTRSCAAKHAKRQNINRQNAMKRWNNGRGNDQQSETEAVEDDRETPPAAAVCNFSLSKTDYNNLCAQLIHDDEISNRKYDLGKFFDTIQHNGWKWYGKPILDDQQLISILQYKFPPEDEDGQLNHEDLATAYLFTAFCELAPDEVYLEDIIELTDDVLDSFHYVYDKNNVRMGAWIFKEILITEQNIRTSVPEVWSNWLEDR